MNLVKAAVIGMGVILASAATAQAETIDVKIPFAFTVGTKTLPAGEYRIERDILRAPSVVLIRGEHGNTAQVMVETMPLNSDLRAGEHPSLVFVPDENSNRLTVIRESNGIGFELAGRR